LTLETASVFQNPMNQLNTIISSRGEKDQKVEAVLDEAEKAAEVQRLIAALAAQATDRAQGCYR
jgi:endo-1,4-beta-D-glucanase Y